MAADMDDAKKRILLEGLDTLNGRMRQLKDIQLAAQAELDCLPETERYENFRRSLFEAIDHLDEVIVDLYYLIRRMEINLSQTIANSPMEEEYLKRPESSPGQQNTSQTPPDELSFFQKLMLGILADKGLQAVDQRYQRKKEESERRWNDTLNWQDAARRDDPDEPDEADDDWFL